MFKDSAKKVEIFVIVTIIAVIGIIYALTRQPVIVPTTENPGEENTQQVAGSAVSYQGVEGKTALELLKAGHVVETQNFSGVGEFVKSIDRVEPDSSHFWAFYVNGKQAEVGAGAYTTKSSDMIEWKLEEIRM